MLGPLFSVRPFSFLGSTFYFEEWTSTTRLSTLLNLLFFFLFPLSWVSLQGWRAQTKIRIFLSLKGHTQTPLRTSFYLLLYFYTAAFFFFQFFFRDILPTWTQHFIFFWFALHIYILFQIYPDQINQRPSDFKPIYLLILLKHCFCVLLNDEADNGEEQLVL